MRSRYTAFALSDFDWLRDTHHPATREAFDEADTRQWNAGNRWFSLKIVRTEGGGVADEAGRVHFEAITRHNGGEHMLTEDSAFAKLEGRWFYVDGVKPQP